MGVPNADGACVVSGPAQTTPAALCAEAATAVVPLTVFTNHRGVLTKRFELSAGDELTSTPAAQLVDGLAETVRRDGLDGLRRRLDALQPEQAVSYGVCGRDVAPVTTQKRLSSTPGAVARDRQHFRWPEGVGVWMLDYDPAPDAAPLPREALVAALREAMPELAGVPLLWAASASSCLYDAATGAELRGLSGQRLYVLVDRAEAIPRLGEILVARLWLAGHGRMAVSSAGSLLRRTLVDASVWQPERLDFAAGASCGPGLEQRRPPRAIVPAVDGAGAQVLQAAAVAPLSTAEAERVEAKVREAQALVRAEADRIRGERRAALAGELERWGVPHDEAERTASEALDDGVLGGAFVLYPEDGEPVTVRGLLDDPTRWDGSRFADPLEPDYRGDARIAVAMLNSARPCLYSHAHGGRRFELLREAAVVDIRKGAEADIADACLAALATTFEVYDTPDGGLVVTVDEQGRVRRLDAHGLRDLLSRHVAFRRPKPRFGGGWDRVPADVPRALADAILARNGRRCLPVLRGVVTAPTLRADGTLLDRPGYDAASGLLGAFDGAVLGVGWQVPTPDAAVAAFARLWAPVAAFPYVSATDRAVALAALLTACVRPTLGTAPAFAFDAPAAGTGKTLLARCAGALAGEAGGVVAFSGVEELQKTLSALLIEGARFVLIDNVSGTLDADALNALLTAETWSTRLLGASKTVAVQNNALLTLSGNNLRLGGDLNRRVLRCRLDAQSETPWARTFDADPLAIIHRDRRALVDAALVILRAYLHAGRSRVAAGGVASFERWDARVRQAVCWLAGLPGLGVELGDPADAIAKGFDLDPDTARLGALLTAWCAMFGEKAVTVREAARVAEQGRCVLDETDPQAALLDAIEEVAGDRGALNTRRLGSFLAAREGRRVDGLRFERGGTSQRALRWRVVRECV